MEREPKKITDYKRNDFPIYGNNTLKVDTSGFSGERIRQKERIVFIENLKKPQSLSQHIDYFDQNYRREGLPADWYNMDGVGFSIVSQMNLLREAKSKGQLHLGAEQTKMDLLGFCLEYLRQGVIFPFEYKIVRQTDGSYDFIDPRYGNKSMLDSVSEQERGGAVKESLARIQDYLITAPDGSASVMVSKSGDSGLCTDQGDRIIYPDTQVYFMKKLGNRIIGSTFRTDFNAQENRLLIKRLTGVSLLPNVKDTEYIRTIACIDPDSAYGSFDEKSLVGVMKQIREGSNRSSFVWENKTWSEMEEDLRKRERLYEFDNETQKIIGEFKVYVEVGDLSDTDLKKAIAATILRLSKLFLVDNKIKSGKGIGGRDDDSDALARFSYGQLLDEVKELPGCAGGGTKKTAVDSLVSRAGVVHTLKDRGYSFDNPGRIDLQDLVEFVNHVLLRLKVKN